ncbi:MAG: CAP domain-containing protein [Myxococcota bacterium]
MALSRTLPVVAVMAVGGCIFGNGGGLGEPEFVEIEEREALLPQGEALPEEPRIPLTDCPVNETPFACEVIDLVNVERQREGLPPVDYNFELSIAAYDHAVDMSVNDYFSHTSQDGRRFTDRSVEAGYDAFPRSENIAYGYASPEDVMVGWMNSPGHRANILDGEADELGVGYYQSGNYWVQNFGIRR